MFELLRDKLFNHSDICSQNKQSKSLNTEPFKHMNHLEFETKST